MADAKPPRKGKSSSKPDLATIGGLLLALGGIAGGMIMEGGKLEDVKQVTSALIVLGGTIGAVMITTPLPVLIRAVKKSRSARLSMKSSGMRRKPARRA